MPKGLFTFPPGLGNAVIDARCNEATPAGHGSALDLCRRAHQGAMMNAMIASCGTTT